MIVLAKDAPEPSEEVLNVQDKQMIMMIIHMYWDHPTHFWFVKPLWFNGYLDCRAIIRRLPFQQSPKRRRGSRVWLVWLVSEWEKLMIRWIKRTRRVVLTKEFYSLCFLYLTHHLHGALLIIHVHVCTAEYHVRGGPINWGMCAWVHSFPDRMTTHCGCQTISRCLKMWPLYTVSSLVKDGSKRSIQSCAQKAASRR